MKRTTVTVYVTKELKEEVRVMARRAGLDESNFVKQLIIEAKDKQDENTKTAMELLK